MTKKIADSFLEQIELIDPTKPVMCYRNLNRRLNGEKGFFSVKQGGIVKFHTRIIYLKNVDFLVNERLRQRVIKNRRKEVHAFVRGYICSPSTYYDGCTDRWFANGLVRYNPYEASNFMHNGNPCKIAILCNLYKADNGMMAVYAKGMKYFDKSLDSVEDRGTMVETVAQHML